MAAIAEHLSCPDTKIRQNSRKPLTPLRLPLDRPAYLAGYLGVVCGLVALLVSFSQTKTNVGSRQVGQPG